MFSSSAALISREIRRILPVPMSQPRRGDAREEGPLGGSRPVVALPPVPEPGEEVAVAIDGGEHVREAQCSASRETVAAPAVVPGRRASASGAGASRRAWRLRVGSPRRGGGDWSADTGDQDNLGATRLHPRPSRGQPSSRDTTAGTSLQVFVRDPSADLQQQVRPRSVHRICCFFTIRLLITWLTVDSTNDVVIVSPWRWRSP